MRRGSRRLVCKRGHAITPENSAPYIGKSGELLFRCKECDRILRHKKRPPKPREVTKTEDQKMCWRCKKWFPHEEFKIPSTPRLRSYCRHCHTVLTRTNRRVKRQDHDAMVEFLRTRIGYAVDRGRTYAEIAEALEVSSASVSDWHSRRVRPQKKTLNRCVRLVFQHRIFDKQEES